MKITQIFYKNTLRNFCYLINFNDGALYCIDPFRSTEVQEHLNNKKLTAIINTHDHCDHFSGNADLYEHFHCLVIAHPKADIPHKSVNIGHREVIHSDGHWSLIALYTPGHTMSHICLLLLKEEIPYALFTGDCFFNAGVGNCHNGGNPEVLFQTIVESFENLPDELLIYPGHEYLKRNLEFTKYYEPENSDAELFLQKVKELNLDEVFFINTMKTERLINTFLRLDSPSLKKTIQASEATTKEVFLKLRELRNKW